MLPQPLAAGGLPAPASLLPVGPLLWPPRRPVVSLCSPLDPAHWQRLNGSPCAVGPATVVHVDPVGQSPSAVQSREHFPATQ
jgi:hypothetical protein